MACISKSELIRLQKRLKRDAAIGADFGISRQAVHQLRKKYGIASVAEANPVRDSQIALMHAAGKSVEVIARKFGLSVSYTYRILSQSVAAAPKRGTRKKAAAKK